MLRSLGDEKVRLAGILYASLSSRVAKEGVSLVCDVWMDGQKIERKIKKSDNEFFLLGLRKNGRKKKEKRNKFQTQQ